MFQQQLATKQKELQVRVIGHEKGRKENERWPMKGCQLHWGNIADRKSINWRAQIGSETRRTEEHHSNSCPPIPS